MPNERENRNRTRSEPQPERACPQIAEAGTRVPRSVNLHLDHRCNYRCGFCYFTVAGHLASVPWGIEPTLPLKDRLQLQRILVEAGVERATYAGGEPTLSPDLEELVLHWYRLHGGVAPCAMIVTNGTFLTEERLRRMQPALAAVKLSAESSNEAIEVALGRGHGDHLPRVIARADTLHRLGIPVDLNSVVCSLNWEEDLTPLVRWVNPRYWKVFQVLPVPEQNGAEFERLRITSEQFRSFVDRHSHLTDLLVSEDNDLMRGSYAMIDPLGRFFQSTPRGYVRSQHSILEVGVRGALAEVSLDWSKYDARGGDERAFGGRRVT
jgi:radical S-adenosyl methionine domain-containing protein 2